MCFPPILSRFCFSFVTRIIFLRIFAPMKASEVFKQYVWLVDTIRRARRISLAELSQRWQKTDLSNGNPLVRSTFNRHREAVEEIFGITIACDADNRYYIVDNEFFRSDTVQQWMLNTLTVSNIVGEVRGLHDRILLESIPTEGETLRLVVEAMQRNVKVHLTYRTYRSNNLSDWTVEPYCIKLFRRRWYLLCRLHDRGFLVLSFDRINSLELTGDTFAIDPTFDANTFFAEYFGVMTDNRVPLQRIVLRAFGNERFALRDLPLHHSQKLVEEGDDYVDFELKLRPTTDFLAHILSRGQWVKIISPKAIAQKIRDLHREALE